MIKLCEENYFSKEASQEYLSVSQYKSFQGSLGQVGCEARALSEIRGEWNMEMTIPLLVGSYIDAHFSNCLGLFKGQYPEIFKKNGDLKSQYIQAEEIIQRIENDPYFSKTMSGEKQTIFTAEVFGVKWKCKIDSLIRDKGIFDLKVMKSLTERKWHKDYGSMNFIQYWGYDIQAAMYQRIVKENIGKTLPFFICGASKEKYTDIKVIAFDQKSLDDVISLVEPNIQRIVDLKSGKVESDRCGICDYCKHTHVITRPIHYSEL